ncbi:hypothetical protein H920_16767 [Fukomys damarensis]|uniref:Uncharacterized protein n=1 Tax=Fukomys damarensis TaxID=885580 RepID=A0A091CRG8_FUKDA|nr:hypothetical protein H920_16767 [Fukomys damarensis]
MHLFVYVPLVFLAALVWGLASDFADFEDSADELPVTSAIHNVDPNDEGVQQDLDFALGWYNRDNNDPYIFLLCGQCVPSSRCMVTGAEECCEGDIVLRQTLVFPS